MWRFILLGVIAVAADDRWSRQATDRRQGDWVPVAAPCPTCHQQFQKGRTFDQDSAAAALPSVLTPPVQQQAHLLPPPPDGLFQQSPSSGFLNNFPNHPHQFNENKPRQFLTQQNLNVRSQDQSTIRFKANPQQITDSAGIPSTLFQVGPQHFTQNSNQQNSQLLAIPQFNGAPFLPQPQRSQIQPFVGLNAQHLQQHIPFNGFQFPDNPPVFLASQPGNISPQQQFNNNFFNQLPQSIMQAPDLFTLNSTNNFKQETQNKGKEEVQLLYVPVETLRQNQKGRNNNIVRHRGNKKVEPSQLKNSFDSLNQPTESNNPIQTTKPVFGQQNIDSREQFFRQNQNIPTTLQDFQLQNHQVIQETTGPQIQFNQNSFLQQLLQDQTTFAQDLKNQQSVPTTLAPLNNKQNKNKLAFEQSQRDSIILNSPQFTYKFQQEPIQQTLNPTTSKLETANYYQSQPVLNQDDYENSQEYTQHTLGSEEQQTTIPPPHQPPLSVYMETNENSKISDVLNHLKNAKTIPVLDTIGPDSPQVFVGPSNLNPPAGYLKFELPYLSAIDSNRVERKVDRLPFFVAPLNFQPPPGYSKIPFPAPHIGSVVVSNATILKAALHEKPDEYITNLETSTQNDINQYTIPSNISPISPQLPSLVNSLQDEKHFPTTTEIPTTTPAQTPVYTTPHRRHPGRGSNRPYSTTSTETPITRRTVSRQRRPHNRPNSSYRNSQAVSTSTTPEPIVATTINPQYEEQNGGQQNIYAGFTTEVPQVSNQNLREQFKFDLSNQDNGEFNGQTNQQQIYNGPGKENSNKQNDQISENYQNGQSFNNVLQSQGITQSVIPQLEQVQQYFTQLQQQQYLQGSNHQKQNQQSQHSIAEEDHPPTILQEKLSQYQQKDYPIPSQNSDVINEKQQDPVINDQYFNNNNNNYSNQFVTDSPQTTENIVSKFSPQTTESSTLNSNKFNHFRRDPLRQRFRGRNQYQTTTEYITTQPEQITQPQRVKHRLHHSQNVQIIRENANNYQDNYPTNTERLDEQSQTERSQGLQFHDNNSNYFNNDQKQFVNIQNQNYQNRPSLNNNGQFYQEQYISQQKTSQYVKNKQQFNDETPKPLRFNKNEQQINENNNQQVHVSLENSTPYTQIKDAAAVFNPKIHNSQQIFTDTSSRYEEHDRVTEKPINQQRLTKYTRLRGNANAGIRDEHQVDQINRYNLDTSALRQNNHYESDSSPSFSSSPPTNDNNQYNTESIMEGITESEQEQVITTTAPKPAVVRVRGRVRNRQRLNGLRHTTTTETPNYPAESGFDSNSDSQYIRKSLAHRLPHVERNNYNRQSNRFRGTNNQNSYSSSNNNNNSNNDSENESRHIPSSTVSTNEDITIDSISSTTTTSTEIPVSRKYNHILNRNIIRRPNSNRQLQPSTTSSSPPSGSTTKYLVRTTRRPTTQVTKLSDGRARIRRPNKLTLTTTTTEYPLLQQAQDSFAPSAASNEVLDPYYPSQLNYNSENNVNHHHINNNNYQTLNRNPVKQFTPSSYESSTILTPTPFSPAPSSNNDDDYYWNHGVTIQQSNSYDFSAESSPATQSTLYNNEGDGYNHRSSPSWDNPSAYSQDQTPFSSDEQYVATYGKNKLKQPLSGKDNRWNKKSEEEKKGEQIDEQLKKQQQLGEESVTNNNNNNQEQQSYYNNVQKQYQNQEYITESTAYRTNFPIDTITEQTVNNKYISKPNENAKDNYKSDFSEIGDHSYTVDDTAGSKDNFNNNLQGKHVDPSNVKKAGRRRGAWVRVRVNKKSKDVFETAESQNLASISNKNNAIDSVGIKGQWNVPANHRSTDPYNTELPQTTSQSVSQTTETPVTIKNDENFKNSLADMIREIIKAEENEEVQEEDDRLYDKPSKNNNETVTVTISPDTVTEIPGTTMTTMQEGIAVTVVPEVVTQVGSTDSESVTIISDEVATVEINTIEPHVLGTSTTTEISLETEICYRGRCVKSKKSSKKPIKSLFSSHRTQSSTLTTSSGIESDLMSVE